VHQSAYKNVVETQVSLSISVCNPTPRHLTPTLRIPVLSAQTLRLIWTKGYPCRLRLKQRLQVLFTQRNTPGHCSHHTTRYKQPRALYYAITLRHTSDRSVRRSYHGTT
jgi:hypothetical protein